MAAREIGRPPPSCVRLSRLDLLRSRGPAPSGVGLDKKGGGGCQVSRLGSPSLRPPLAPCSPSLARRSAPAARSRWTCTARPWTRGRRRSSPATGTTSDTGPNGSRVACSSSSCSPHVRPTGSAGEGIDVRPIRNGTVRRSASKPRPWPRPDTRSIARTTRPGGIRDELYALAQRNPTPRQARGPRPDGPGQGDHRAQGHAERPSARRRLATRRPLHGHDPCARVDRDRGHAAPPALLRRQLPQGPGREEPRSTRASSGSCRSPIPTATSTRSTSNACGGRTSATTTATGRSRSATAST